MQEEVWKAIPRFEGRYDISSWGRVRSNNVVGAHRHVNYLKPHKTKFGYVEYQGTVNNKNCRIRAHREVALAFLPNPNLKTQVNHIDGDKQNNHLLNLEWCTPQENMDHAYATGLKSKDHITRLGQQGRRIPLIEVPNIRRRYAEGNVTQRALANEYGVERTSVHHIVKFKGSYEHV